MGGGGGSTQNYEASLPFAELARAQWKDYKKRFMPFEKMLITQGLDANNYIQDVNVAKNAVDSAFSQQDGAFERNMDRMGVVMNPAEQNAIEDNMARDKATTMVGEMNSARNNVWDRQNSIMSGGLSSVNRTIRK